MIFLLDLILFLRILHCCVLQVKRNPVMWFGFIDETQTNIKAKCCTFF